MDAPRDLTAGLFAAAAEYCARTRMSRARLATIVINDGKFFDRVEAGGGLTVKTYERFMAYFAEHANDRPKAEAPNVDEPTPAPLDAAE